jgi:membrane protein DedA with SNARE-associated domain
MKEFTSIMAVAAILWTLLIIYVGYLDSKVRALENKLKR